MPPDPGSVCTPSDNRLAKVLFVWGARLTWTAQRKYAAKIVKVVETHKIASHFLSFSTTLGVTRMGGRGTWPGFDHG